MMKYGWLAALGCLLAVLAVSQAKALMIAPPPGAARVATADLIVVGKVTAVTEKTVKGEMFKNDTREMKVATLKVEDVLLGKGVKTVKVGFFPPQPVDQPKDGIRRPIRRMPTVQLSKDDEVCLFLTKHPTKRGVYIAVNYYDAMQKQNNPNFAKEVEEIKKAAKLLEKPMDGLKSKDADERFQTAALLLTRYRNKRSEEQKTEEVDADESKLILQTLAEADWQPRNQKFGYTMTPMNLFFRLELTQKDGWKQPENGQNIAEEAKKWCKENAGKYKIKRYVSESKPASKDEPEPDK